MSSIDITLAGREHLAAIPLIETAAAAMFCEADLPLEIRYRVTDIDALAEAQGASRLWVALNGDRRPVGFALANTIDGAAHLDEMGVLPQFGRRGIGTRLLETIISWAQARRFPRLTLVTFRHLPWNAPFYERMGFTAMAESDLGEGLASLLHEEAAAGIDVRKRVCMRLELAP